MQTLSTRVQRLARLGWTSKRASRCERPLASRTHLLIDGAYASLRGWHYHYRPLPVLHPYDTALMDARAHR